MFLHTASLMRCLTFPDPALIGLASLSTAIFRAAACRESCEYVPYLCIPNDSHVTATDLGSGGNDPVWPLYAAAKT